MSRLNPWSWIWALLESLTLAISLIFIFAVFGRWLAAFCTLSAMALGILLISALYAQCPGLALDEVAAITGDEGRREAIRGQFCAL